MIEVIPALVPTYLRCVAGLWPLWVLHRVLWSSWMLGSSSWIVSIGVMCLELCALAAFLRAVAKMPATPPEKTSRPDDDDLDFDDDDDDDDDDEQEEGENLTLFAQHKLHATTPQHAHWRPGALL